MNASEDTQVGFACQSSFSQADVQLVVVPLLPPNAMLQGPLLSVKGLPGGGHEKAISFTATTSVNETMIECRATDKTNETHTEVGPPALLLVQGKGLLRKTLHKNSVKVFQVPPLV